MNIVGILPARNEDWILALSARAALRWCDSLIVLDHASTDRTPEILQELQDEYGLGRLGVMVSQDREWPEMEHRQMLLNAARDYKATHIATIDADEVLTANLVPDVRSMFETLPAGVLLQLPLQCLRGSINTVHQSGIWSQQFTTVGFVDSPELHWSSAERGGYQYHHREPMGAKLAAYRAVGFSRGGLMHLQFVDDKRLRAKQYLYCLNERLRWAERMTPQQVVDYYSPAVYGRTKGDMGPLVLGETPAEWWRGYEDLLPHLHLCREAWQLAECRRIVRENPGIEAGLDNFGLELK